MTMNSLTLVSWLLLAPPETTYEKSLDDLGVAAQSIVELSPADAIMKIDESLAAVAQHPEALLRDSTALDKIARARLALVWAHMAEGNSQAATTTMDDAIRGSAGRALPLAGLGPAVRELSEARRQQLALGGTATIEVDCDDCQVLVNESAAANPTAALLLGRHRVWAFDPSGKLQATFFDVTLETPGEAVTLVFRAPSLDTDTDDLDTLDIPDILDMEVGPRDAGTSKLASRTNTAFKPRVPRWAKILGMGVGAGLAVAGGVLLSLDGKCKNGDVATPENVLTDCQDVWTHEAPGYALLGAGAGVLMGAGVWLTVDEVRAQAGRPAEVRGAQSRKASAMISWTFRF